MAGSTFTLECRHARREVNGAVASADDAWRASHKRLENVWLLEQVLAKCVETVRLLGRMDEELRDRIRKGTLSASKIRAHRRFAREMFELLLGAFEKVEPLLEKGEREYRVEGGPEWRDALRLLKWQVRPLEAVDTAAFEALQTRALEGATRGHDATKADSTNAARSGPDQPRS